MNGNGYSDEQFCYDVLDSDLDPIEKIKLLSNSSQYGCNIVSEILKFGPYLQNYLEDLTVFACEESTRDFIGGTWFRFDALRNCCREIKSANYKELYKRNEKKIFEIEVAIAIVDLYDSLELLWIPPNCDDEDEVEEFYKTAMRLVDLCAFYFKEARLLYQNDLVYYRFKQQAIVEKHFDVLRRKRDQG